MRSAPTRQLSFGTALSAALVLCSLLACGQARASGLAAAGSVAPAASSQVAAASGPAPAPIQSPAPVPPAPVSHASPATAVAPRPSAGASDPAASAALTLPVSSAGSSATAQGLSASAAAAGSPTPTSTPSATPTPAGPVPPQAPGAPQGEFEVLTATGKAPIAAVHLAWDPAEAGDYLLKGYRIYRATAGTGAWTRRPKADAAETMALELDDPASVGAAYDYAVSAVDAKGNEGPRSDSLRMDLTQLPPYKLAPPAPTGMTATSRRFDVKLRWNKPQEWISPWSAFRIYRATSIAGLAAGHFMDVTSTAPENLPVSTLSPTAQGATSSAQSSTATAWAWGSSAAAPTPSPTATATATSGGWLWNSSTPTAGTGTAQSASGTAQAASGTAQAASATAAAAMANTSSDYFFYDSPPAQSEDFYYAVTTLDLAGHESPLSLTVTGRATGTLPPGPPRMLTSTSKTEKVSLNWKPSDPGTAPISAYLLQRREVTVDHWRKVAFLGVSDTSYADSLEGDREYVYRMAAIDAEGNTGLPAFVGGNPAAKELNKTLVVIMPTAYANNKGYDSGFNLNVIFDFYVGSLFETYTSPVTGRSDSSIFQKLEIGTVTGDFKYAFLNDRGWVPGFATGLYTAALIGFGGNSETVGVSSNGGSISTLGNVYAVLSKRFLPDYNPDAAVHLGLMYGKLADYLASPPMPQAWWPTIRHLTPGGDFPTLFSQFVDPSLGQTVGQAPHMAYAGLTFPFSVPLGGGSRWRSGLRLEAMVPLPWDAEYPPNPPSTATENGNPASQLPYLINIHVDNLPLFGFEFGLFEFSGGYEVIAFYHIPDLTWAW